MNTIQVGTPIEVVLEFGHTAVLKDKPVILENGVTHTHDWHLFVRSPDGGNCEDYLNRVVFMLTKDYKKSYRNVKVPPYEIKESGYKSFNVIIDLIFKSTNDHFKKTHVIYEVVLQPNKDIVSPTDPAYQHEIKLCRREKLTIPGTVGKDLRRRLLRSGGKPVDLSSSTDQAFGSKTIGSTDSTKEKETSKERNNHTDWERDEEKSRGRDMSRDRDSNNTAIEIELEFGHTAVLKDKPFVHQSGITHTHDWHLFVRSPDGDKCEDYLNRVVFLLPKGYKRRYRNVKEPPFEIKKSGYESLNVFIDLFFKSTNAHFKKTRVNYEVLLQPNKDVVPPPDPAYQHEIKLCRREKLLIPGTVDKDLRRRLLRSGGKPVDLPSRTDQASGSKTISSTNSTKEKETSKERNNHTDWERDGEKSRGRDRSRDRDSNNTAIEIELEFGHTAVLKDKPVVHQSGITHTHDWHLHVKAQHGGKCENYLEKVVFMLNKSYQNPMRNVKAPPFQIKESGYGSFKVPIDLYFKTTGPHFRKRRVNYELVLQPNKDVVLPTDPAYQHEIKMCHREKLTFPGTVDESFKRRLLRGGGRTVDLQTIRTDRVEARKDREEESSKDMSSHISRENNKSNERDKRRDRSGDREKSNERDRVRDRSRDREKSNERDILRDMSRDREKFKERGTCRQIEREKSKDRNSEGIHCEEKLNEDGKGSVLMDKVGSEKELEIKEEADIREIESNKRTNIAMESQAKKRSKLETYCLLCQEDDHVLNDDCVVNAICLSCGVKGHVRRDCYCLICQEYGHVLNDDCTTCFNCGTKGHVRRDCPFISDEN